MEFGNTSTETTEAPNGAGAGLYASPGQGRTQFGLKKAFEAVQDRATQAEGLENTEKLKAATLLRNLEARLTQMIQGANLPPDETARLLADMRSDLGGLSGSANPALIQNIIADIQKELRESDDEETTLKALKIVHQQAAAEEAKHKASKKESSWLTPSTLFKRNNHDEQAHEPRSASRQTHQSHDDDGDEVTHSSTRKSLSVKAGAVVGLAKLAKRGGFLDKKALKTAEHLADLASNGTAAQQEYAQQEIKDAVLRRIGWDDFLGQEARDASSELEKDKNLSEKYGTVFIGIRSSTIIDSLVAKGVLLEDDKKIWDRANNRESTVNVMRIDTNADGQVSAQEFKNALEKGSIVIRQAHEAYQQKAQIREARGGFDADKDGRLSKDEIDAAIKAAKTTFVKADIDHNGSISNAELALIKRRAEAPMAARLDDTTDYLADKKAGMTHLGKEVKPILADFQKYARIYDTDRDGKVELHEVVDKLKSRGITDLKDMNGNGRIDIQDVAKIYDARLPGAAQKQKH